MQAAAIDAQKPASERETAPPKDKPKAGAPTLDEYQSFFSRVVIKTLTSFYVEMAMRDIDGDMLSDREIDQLEMGKEERDRLALPFAEFSNKSKFMRKHGRMVVSSADSIDALITLGIWARQVNKIAAKHRPVTAVNERANRGKRSRTDTGTPDAASANGTGVITEPTRIFAPGTG